uniref:Polyketide synthase n=1 Tax=uncultured Acidobacteria bacterium A11 TaxID=1036854 RepID=F8TTL0_9BACT|nr:polyketide synthase [uncultured Acidobacteria bacterium A11]
MLETAKPNCAGSSASPSLAPAIMPPGEPIAIVGIGCRFPGGVRHADSLWKLMCDGVDAITEIPKDRWSVEQFHHPDPLVLGTTYSKWGGFVEGMNLFDPGAFGISPREAVSMDPQQRLMLEVTLGAMEDGGFRPGALRGSSAGVFVGISTWDYSQLQYESSAGAKVDPYAATGTALSIAANRISYCFDLHGPSMVVDTACSSSLVAVHLACGSIWKGECQMAFAGGVNAFLSPANAIAFSKMGVLSPDGRCKTFDTRADGFVRAEGAGVVLLKPLAQALRDADRIYAVVQATGVNQDGVTNGLAVPNGNAQAALIRETLDRAGLDPGRVAYVEAHGTGTAVGDPTEAHAIGSTIGSRRNSGPCLMGSVKTNIGHLEAAAGIAGLIKTALIMQHGAIPPNLHFQTPNPLIDFARLGLEVPTGLRRLHEENGAAAPLAMVNSFGFGGTNALAVLSAAPRKAAPAEPDGSGPWLIPISATSEERLGVLADSWSEFLGDKTNLESIGRTAALRREHKLHRLCLVAANGPEGAERIHSFRAGERAPGVVTGKARSDSPPKVAFVFSGQGPQWFGMGRGLLAGNQLYRGKLEECDELVRRLAGWSLIEALSAPEELSRIGETAIAQPALCALQIALAHVWMNRGIQPVATVGHSVGELAAAHVAGRLTLEETMRIVVHRGDCIARFARKGRMLAAALHSDRAHQLLRDRGASSIAIAAFNGPGQVTFAGATDALEVFAGCLEEDGVQHQLLHVDYAFHSDLMDPAREPFLTAVGGTRSQAGAVRWFSTVTETFIDNGGIDGDYWWRNVRQPVRFVQAVEQLIDEGCDCFLEISPHPVLLPSITESLRARGREARVAFSLRRDADDEVSMLANLGQLHGWGCAVNWQALYPNPHPPVDLPPFPWMRESYWCAGEGGHRPWLEARVHPLLGTSASLHKPVWRTRIDLHRLPFLREHRLQNRALFPATGYLEMAMAASREILGVKRPVLENLELRKAMFLPAEPETAELLTEYEPADRELRFFSRIGTSTGGWTLHCRMRLGGDNGDAAAPRFDRESAIRRCPETFPGEIIYEIGEVTQLEYGESFRGLKEFWRSSTEVVARIELPENVELDEGGWIFHPAFLDACIQAGNLHKPLEQSAASVQGSTFVPVGAGEMRLQQKPTSRTLWVHVLKTRDTPRSQCGDIWIYDDEGFAVLSFRGFESQRLELKAVGDGASIDDWTCELSFIPTPRPSPDAAQPAPGRDGRWPSLASLAEEIRGSLEDILAGAARIKRFGVLREKLNELALTWWECAFRALGLAKCDGLAADIRGIIQACGIAPSQERYATYAVACLERAGVIRATESKWTIAAEPVMRADPATLWNEMLAEFPMAYAELMILQTLGGNLPALLKGETTLQEQLFNRAAEGLLDHFYQDSIGLISRNAALAQVVGRLAAAPAGGRKMRVLEIGAGTGGVTSHILPLLEGRNVEYCFTDVSPAFLATARRRYSDFNGVDYRVLDLEKDPVAQEFGPHEYDVIIAANVVHAVPDVARSLAHIRRLLAPDGVFCLLEVVTAPSSLHFIFGLTEQWWIHQDDRMQPISREQWQRHLAAEFSEVVDLSEGLDASGSELAEIAVFLARGDHIVSRSETTPSAPDEIKTPDRAGNWLILGDRRLGPKLADLLSMKGASCLLVPAEAGLPRIAHELQVAIDVGNPFDAVVHLWPLDCVSNDELSLEAIERDAPLTWESALELVKKIAQIESASRPRIFAVTSGIESVGGSVGPAALSQSTIRGVFTAAVCEYPALQMRLIDLDPAIPPGDQAGELLLELSSGDTEQEVAFRDRSRFVARLRSITLTETMDSGKIWLRHGTAHGEPGPRFELFVPSGGTLDRLGYRETRERPLLRNQLEVRVIAAGLNFRDVLKALGRYPLDGDYLTLGDECSGVVERVGEDVTEFRVGDEVICAGAPCFASHVITLEHLTMPKPAHLMFEEAATLPIAFLTAHYCLHDVAGLQAGETVLIHAAAGGVGLAAIQIARLAGARIIATASSRKQGFVRLLGVEHVLDSRSLEFAEQIRQITDGRGVDVILNSLAGEAIEKSLSILARYGRFVEIGKRDLYENRNLALGFFREGITFHSIDLSRVMADRPDLIRRIRGMLIEAFQSGRLHPLAHRIFAANRIRDAFRTMADARHVGKIVISLRRPDIRVEPLPPVVAPLHEQATYLITGGTGGFGVEIARAMLCHGARTIVLLGRSDPSSEKVSRALDRLSIFKNARIVPIQVDVADPVAMADVFRRMRDELPPLRGVVHAAGFLEDGPVVQMDAASFRRVLAPKVHGLWNLHELTRELSLDFFSITGSSASLLGNAGQANYAAANAFLDTFAWFRSMSGLPANVVNFGPLTEAGMVARDPGLIDRMARLGVTMMPMRKGIEILRAAQSRRQPQIGAIRVRWSRWLDAVGFASVPSKILDLYEKDAATATAEQNSSELLQSLRQASAGELPDLVMSYVASTIARVLGTQAEKLDPAQPLQALGLDSLATVELCNRIEGDLRITMPHAELAKKPTLVQLAALVLSLLPQKAGA